MQLAQAVLRVRPSRLARTYCTLSVETGHIIHTESLHIPSSFSVLCSAWLPLHAIDYLYVETPY